MTDTNTDLGRAEIHAQRIASRRGIAQDCRDAQLAALLAVAQAAETVNALASLQPAALAMDPNRALEQVRLIAGAAQQQARAAAIMAAHAAEAWERLAKEQGESFAALEAMCRLMLEERAKATGDALATMLDGPGPEQPRRPVLAVGNGGLPN